ncbi:MAG: pyruvate, phosphate dikinase [Acidobacteria bacterium]|nr:pyruvate, phosphate dikinase [Acidobacteriota bacterium]
MAKKKYVYFFSAKKTDGSAKLRDLLGGKGANLAEMSSLGLPVPPGFTITTEACIEYLKTGDWPTGLLEEVESNLKAVEKLMGREFGNPNNPLLFSVRSGAKFSMPGMMDTVLNLGLNDNTVEGIARMFNDRRFAMDSYRRFITMFSDVVMGIPKEHFDEKFDAMKEKVGAKVDTDLDEKALEEIVKQFKQVYKKHKKSDFPTEPMEQLKLGIEAVFKSWNTNRAKTYRRLNNLPDNLGTGVNVQVMVFGNLNENSATGVAFTRDPGNGEKRFFGEYLVKAQGEDVVAGIRTPRPINKAAKTSDDLPSLEEVMPGIYKDLVTIYKNLEKHYRDMQDIEFTIEDGKLYILQTRNGKRTAPAAVKIAVDMVKEKLISKEEAIMRVDPASIDQLLHPQMVIGQTLRILGKGLPASPGAGVGKIVLNADAAEEAAEKGEKVVLVRLETSPEDIGGMDAAQGILTARGGMTSHAAVVARGMGKPCVAGCGNLSIDEKKKIIKFDDITLKVGDYISINGNSGNIFEGEAKLVEPKLAGEFGEFMKWSDEFRKINVRTNADTPHDSKVARNFGAEGIGLCRTEHMFFGEDRITSVREMILSKTETERRKALKKLLPMQRKDFFQIFKAMDGLPVTIRLLDPPLHEFLPHTDKEDKEVSEQMGVSVELLKKRVQELKEFNPMLGHRGCRLGITYPEIYEMQVTAIFEAAIKAKQAGIKVYPEIMIPLVGHYKEFDILKEMTIRIGTELMKKAGVDIKYMVGTMIEIPRAALTADEIAREAEFFSFGTNDLTQMGFGFSRDDAGAFLGNYVKSGILPKDPFQVLDQDGIGQLVKMGIEKGRSTRPELKVGICGEHGGEPSSVEFCHRIGMNYVSCSPFRVPIARLAAAQAALKDK